MQSIKSERGYALLIVLLTIVIITIAMPPLLSKLFSTAEQNNQTLQSIQHEKLQGMATEYTSEMMTQYVKGWSVPSVCEEPETESARAACVRQNLFNDLKNYMTGQLNGNVVFQKSGQNFSVLFKNIDQQYITIQVNTIVPGESNTTKNTIQQVKVPELSIIFQ